MDEVSAALAFLAGPDPSYINGATLTIDGGFSAKAFGASGG